MWYLTFVHNKHNNQLSKYSKMYFLKKIGNEYLLKVIRINKLKMNEL